MKWIPFIKGIEEDCKFYPPAQEEAITRIEEMFQIQLPKELKELLRETDGVTYTEYDLSFVWDAEGIQRENFYMRGESGYAEFCEPFDSFLFVADVGNGDLFGYYIKNGVIESDDIYVWDHEDDSRRWIAPSLRVFVEGWYSGKISI